jgi:hypothetical protein
MMAGADKSQEVSLRYRWWLLGLGVALPAVAATKTAGGPPASDLAQGALSFLVSKRCEKSPREELGLEFPALTYGRGRPPAWGKKMAGVCRGLDTWVVSESLAAGAYWGQNDHAAIEASPNDTLFDDEKTSKAFKTMFGWEMPERGDYVPPADVFLKFDAKKVAAVFDRFYVKPADTIAALPAQQVYDVLLKELVTRFAREAAFVSESLPKAKRAKLLTEYQAAAKDGGTRFQGPAYLKEVAASALPANRPEAQRAGRTLGVLLRRTADGTWPTITRLLKKVLADYDPALAKELGKKL